MCWVVWGSRLEQGRHIWCLGHWPAGLEWLLAGSPDVCGDTLLFLPASLFRVRRLQAV